MLLLLILMLLCLLHRCSNVQQSIGAIEQGVIKLPRGTDTQALVDEAVGQRMFEVFMNTAITINSENEANLFIQNSKSNHYSAYVKIYKDNELLYESDTIQPGYKLEKDKLQKDLNPGTYDCKAYFHILDLDANLEINKIGLSVTIKKEIENK